MIALLQRLLRRRRATDSRAPGYIARDAPADLQKLRAEAHILWQPKISVLAERTNAKRPWEES